MFFSDTVTQEVAAAALQALDAVHKCGLLHGDVEACNFMVGEGKQPIVLFLDFGFLKPSSCGRFLKAERKALEHLLRDMVLD